MDNVARHSLARRNAQQLAVLQLHVTIIVSDSVLLDPLHVELLEAVDKSRSITAAAKHLKISYAFAWRLLADLGSHFSEPLVNAQRGGRAHGGCSLTETGREILDLYHKVRSGAAIVAEPFLMSLRARLKQGSRTARD
jgi:molybdate transport system regulatory protein